MARRKQFKPTGGFVKDNQQPRLTPKSEFLLKLEHQQMQARATKEHKGVLVEPFKLVSVARRP